MSRLSASAIALVFVTSLSFGASTQELLVRFHSVSARALQGFAERHGGKLEVVSEEGALYKWTTDTGSVRTLDSEVMYIQTNRSLGMLKNPSIESQRAAFLDLAARGALPRASGFTDNPDIAAPAIQASGTDPLVEKSWGLAAVGAPAAWQNTNQGKDIIVAVTDTGVDYTHPDLIHSMWRNKTEIAGNGVDEDGNGYVDDMVGWDFAGDDNKPYDMTPSLLEILLQGGNPGHGTHVSGVISATLNNAQGVAGLAPQAKIMAVRFIDAKGQGSDENAIKGIDYAVKNGARIINASWGGEKGGEDDKALQEAIERANEKGVLFVAAAGNGRVNQAEGKAHGFDNDADAKPMIPASFTFSNMVTVAAVDSADKLAEFSNWGHKSTAIGAPGVKIMSTVPGDRYQDTVIDLGPLKATWDGTSMAAPHVAGALAVIWSQNASMTAAEVRAELLAHSVKIDSLSGKVASEGKLSIKNVQ